jgi:Lrp/AsnC family leucine-responsive transcriptional regulator
MNNMTFSRLDVLIRRGIVGDLRLSKKLVFRKECPFNLKNFGAMDEFDWKVLSLLQQNGRMTYTELARQVHLSVPAVTERVKRLEEAGIIEGYAARINPVAVGYAVSALVGITVSQPAKAKFLSLLDSISEVLECHHVTGADSYVLRLVAVSMVDLERLIERINLYGETRTSIVMSTPLVARALGRPHVGLPKSSNRRA